MFQAQKKSAKFGVAIYATDTPLTTLTASGEMVLVRNFAIIGTIMTAYKGLLLELLKVPSLRITCFFCYSNAHSKPMQACSKIGSVHKKNEDIFDAATVAPPHTLSVTGNKSFHHKYGEKKYGTCWSIF